MSQTQTHEERRSALDDFARTPQSQGELVPVSAYAPPVDHQHGAIAVAVHRDEALILQRIKALAAAAGSDWYYRWPVKNRKENRVDFVEGPSIKCANDLARLYGNNDTDVRYQDAGTHWAFHARFIDLETGFSLTRPFLQRKTGGTMGDDPDRRLDIAFQIGASKAIRNVVVNALQTFADFAVTEAKNALVDKIGSDLHRWRRIAVERVSARVELARVEAVVGRKSDDWLAPDVAKVIAMMTAVVDGMASLDETFPPIAKEAPGSQALDQFASGQAQPGTEAGAADGPAFPASATDAPAHPSPAADTPPERTAGEPAGSTPASSNTQAATQPEPTKAEAIRKVLAAATDKALSVDDRLANLDGLMPVWEERLADHPGFARQLIVKAAEVARGELKAAEAKRYLEALP